MKQIKKIATIAVFVVVSFFLYEYVTGLYGNLPGSEDTPDNSAVQVADDKEAKEGKDVIEYLAQLCKESSGGLSDGVYDSEEYFFVLADGSGLKSDGILSVTPRMGYIFVSTSDGEKIMSSDGAVLYDNRGGELSFVGERDAMSRPVFLLDGEYYIINSAGAFESTEYDDRTMSRGIKFDYPSYYGVSDNPDIKIKANSKYFGYESGGENITSIGYKKAFAYSEGFGCAYDEQGRLYFFNEEGRVRVAGLNDIMYGCGEQNDESSLGFYYFDEGLTRALIKTFKKGELISERQILIDRAGDEFYLPQDYTLYSYSNGMMLMQKGEKYGYMNSRGRWIAEPEYTYARPFFEGLAVVGNKDGKKGMIDKNGNFVIEPIFDKISDCSGGIIALYSAEHGWFIIKKCI